MNRKTIIYISASIAVVVVSCMVFYKCQEKPYNDSKSKPTATVQPIIDQKQRMVDSLLATVNRLVSSMNNSKQSIIIERGNFQNGYEGALQSSPDVCLPTIKTMYQQAMKMDSVSQVVIRKQDSTIVAYSKTVNEQKDVISLKTFQIQQKTDSLAWAREEKKLTAKATRRERIVAKLEKVGIAILNFGAGFGAGKVIP